MAQPKPRHALPNEVWKHISPSADRHPSVHRAAAHCGNLAKSDIDAALCVCTRPIIAGISQSVLGRLEVLLCTPDINVGDAYSRFRQHSTTLTCDFGETASHENTIANLTALVNFNHTRTNRGNQRSVAGQNAEIAFTARHDNHVDRQRNNEAFWRNQLKSDFIVRHISQS
jgi:hypothetical protein